MIKKKEIDLNHIHCIYCGKHIPRNKVKLSHIPKFCSSECSYNYQRDKARITVQCLNCNKDIILPNKEEKFYNQFCSEACALEYKSKVEKGLISTFKNLPFREGICPCCNKKFYYISNHIHKFCSRKCSNIVNQSMHKKICQHCGKEFIAHHKTAKYCSKECQFQGSKTMTVVNDNNKKIHISLAKANEQIKNSLKHLIITKESLKSHVNDLKDIEFNVLNILLQYYSVIEYQNSVLELNDGRLITTQFYCPENGYYYFIAETEKMRLIKINQYIEEHKDCKIACINKKVLWNVMKTNKLLLPDELNDYYSFDEAMKKMKYVSNDAHKNHVLFLQTLTRHKVLIYVDLFFKDKWILKKDINLLITTMNR